MCRVIQKNSRSVRLLRNTRGVFKNWKSPSFDRETAPNKSRDNNVRTFRPSFSQLWNCLQRSQKKTIFLLRDSSRFYFPYGFHEFRLFSSCLSKKIILPSTQSPLASRGFSWYQKENISARRIPLRIRLYFSEYSVCFYLNDSACDSVVVVVTCNSRLVHDSVMFDKDNNRAWCGGGTGKSSAENELYGAGDQW